jgi:dihydrolipoamide dehydrogenase
LRSSEIFYYLNHANDYGLMVEGRIGFDPNAVVARSRKVSAQLNNGVGFLLKKNKVDIVCGEATIKYPGEVLVPPQGLQGSRQILCRKVFWTQVQG